MKIKIPKKIELPVELPEKFVKLLEEAHIVARFIGPLDAERCKEKIREEEPLVYITSLFLATIDEVNRRSSITAPWIFRTASSEEY